MAFKLITWERFITMNNDARGIRFKFEDLCRQLFTNEFLSQNKKTKCVHSNPNNAGIEADPVYDEVNQRQISFQAKFFDDKVGYDQILHSAKNTVEHYAGRVDHVFLYSNKQLSTKADNYQKAIQILADNNITLEPVTGDTILDQVRKYPYLASYYFGNHPITHDWIKKHNVRMFSELGERFNSEFNVDTDYSLQISLFVRDEAAVKYINSKKEKLIQQIDSLGWGYDQYRGYLKKIKNIVCNTPDISYDNTEAAFLWESSVKSALETDIKQFEAIKIELESKQNELDSSVFQKHDISAQDKEKAKNEYYDIRRKLEVIDVLLELPDFLTISEFERQLILGKILAVTGEAGIGKSQLFANEADNLLKDNRNVLLFLAGLCFTDAPIQEQIISNCGLECSFDELIDIFEAMGEAEGKFIPLFIDALNETWNSALWKSFLPLAVEKIESCNYVKLAFSFRTEYEKLLMNQSLIERMKNQSICYIFHKGFEKNSLEATKRFFDYYGISFTLSEFFEYEMTNPLFLTLYCRTYEGDEVDLPALYERLISNANRNIHKSLKPSLRTAGYLKEEDLLTPLIDELAGLFADRGVKQISKEELLDMSYWKHYKIAAPSFISQVVKEHILYSYVYEEKEKLYFAYDQMNDYFCAKAIVKQAGTKDAVRAKIVNDILKIKDGQVGAYGNRDLFVNICALYRDKFGEECIDLIDEIKDDYEKYDLFDRYIQSFQWRNKCSISGEEFLDLIRKYPAELGLLWNVLIGNSIKIEHPLNADFLHGLLMGYDLNKRDYMWTIQISGIFSDATNRVTQLIQMFNQGEIISMKSSRQIELLLTLFGWFLAVSNRAFRDYTSKAMIELMKRDFELCEIMLRKFEKVNDPYIIQRLYGVVFGVCCKCCDIQNDVYKSLSEYVYMAIFCQDIIYPDILLRDYARLIIEKYLFDHPEYDGMICKDKIVPPYKSFPIPDVVEDYTQAKFEGGLLSVSMSMKFSSMGMYGDFGRYVFQSVLRNFDIEDKQIYNYAMSFIINDLGYKEEWFDEFDRYTRRYSFNRHNTIKVERIGKKYQWIAMYNILARISDYCDMKTTYNINDGEKKIFKGAWEPCVRDFDPTLNCNFMFCEGAPKFKQIDDFLCAAQDENRQAVLTVNDNFVTWLEDEGVFLKNLKYTNILVDADGISWIALTKYIDTGHNELKDEKLLVWSWLYAYFVTPEQERTFIESANKGMDFRSFALNLHNQAHEVFNREYPWSPSCKSLKECEWVDANIRTGEKEMVTETVRMPSLPPIEELLKRIGRYTNNETEEELPSLDYDTDDKGIRNEMEDFKIPEIRYEEKEITVEKEVEINIGKILHASSDLVWEEQYDASKKEAISLSVPCAELIEMLHLRQLKSDGFYYDEAGEIAAFDTSITQKRGGVVVRKDLLDAFLMDSGKKLIWILNASKEVHALDMSISQSSDWMALLSYDGMGIQGDVYRIQEHES